MAGLEGTIKTPLGVVQKKTALIFVGGVVVLGGIVWYRQKQLGGAPADATAQEAAINPATGYPYGSPEDAAALESQSAYVSPTIPTGGGSNVPTSNVGFSSNGQWTQAVVEYFNTNVSGTDIGLLTAALGKYVTGAYVNDSEVSLVQQAIAAQGYPPIAGQSGYPPSLNRTAPTGPPAAMTAPKNIKALRVDKKGVSLDWDALSGAKGYKVYIDGKLTGINVLYSTSYVPLMYSNHKYTIGIAGIWPGDKIGPIGNITITTKK